MDKAICFFAALATIIAATVPFCTPPTELESLQFQGIEKAIKSTKIEFSTEIEVSFPDTIKVKDADNKRIINNIYIDNDKTKDAQPK